MKLKRQIVNRPNRVMRRMQDASRDVFLSHEELRSARDKGLVFYELTNSCWMAEDKYITEKKLKGIE